jgi:hypothetical protein
MLSHSECREQIVVAFVPQQRHKERWDDERGVFLKEQKLL